MSDATAPAVLAEAWRGQVLEATIRGHVVVVDADGAVLASAGDPEVVTPMRSAVKSFQAIPLARARHQLDLPSDELAIACASHTGAAVHLATARRLLARVGLDESALSCGPQRPADHETQAGMARDHVPPLPIHNNCSGKHSGMLAACIAHGWPVEGYADPQHPLQREVEAHMGRLFGISDMAAQPRGVDGCGLITHGLPLSSLARGFVAGTRDADVAACQAAMVEHPVLVAGEAQLDTLVLRHLGQALVCKGGGAAIWAAATRDSRLGIAVKLESGSAEFMAAVVGSLLAVLRVLPSDPPVELEDRLLGARRNWAGSEIGEVRPALPPHFRAALA